MDDVEDSEDLARRAYALYCELQPRAPRWSDLRPSNRGLLTFLAHYCLVNAKEKAPDG